MALNNYLASLMPIGRTIKIMADRQLVMYFFYVEVRFHGARKSKKKLLRYLVVKQNTWDYLTLLKKLFTYVCFYPSCMWMYLSMPTTIFEDNQSALYLANNPLHKERTKHINIRYHFVRERIQSHEVVVEKVDTKFNIADLFTKPVDNTTFYRLLDKLLGQIKE